MQSVEHEAGLELARKLNKAEDQRDALLSATRKLLRAIKVLGYEPVDEDYTSIVEQAEIAIEKTTGICRNCHGAGEVPDINPRDWPVRCLLCRGTGKAQ